MNIEEYRGIWVFAEQKNGKLLEVALELLGSGRTMADKLSTELSAVLIGNHIAHLVDELGAYGADKVYLLDSPILEDYRSEPYALLMNDLINQYKPATLLIGATTIGMDLAPRVAAKVGTGLSAHCTELDIDESGQLAATVPAFGGSVMASIVCPNRRPQMATVRPGFMKKIERDAGRKALVERIEVSLPEKSIRTKVVEVFREEPKSLPIELAETVVAGGYGVGSKENWVMVEELADVLHASVGATRPAADEGWASLEEQMIGQSGKTVHPNLYIGIGISGVIHHLIGIKDAKVIVAINNDPNAAILKAADYGIVADFRDILPHLIRGFKEALQEV